MKIQFACSFFVQFRCWFPLQALAFRGRPGASSAQAPAGSPFDTLFPQESRTFRSIQLCFNIPFRRQSAKPHQSKCLRGLPLTRFSRRSPGVRTPAPINYLWAIIDSNHTRGVEGVVLGQLVQEHHLIKVTFSEPLLSTNWNHDEVMILFFVLFEEAS